MKYLLTKIKNYSFKQLLIMELESYLLWSIRDLPGVLGYLLRFIVYKILLKELSSFCIIQPHVYIIDCSGVSIGKNFTINSNCYINGYGKVNIGDNVLIGPNVVIASGQHQYNNSKIPVTFQKILPKKIVIESDCWIGANVVIMPGVRISKGTCIGAGSIVTKSTKPYTIVAGVPAKIIKLRN